MKIDAHQHFWRLANPWTDWPTPDLATIHRDYGPDDLAPLLAETAVDGTILVQAAPSFDETLDLLRIARETPWVVGVVGWIDFAAPARALASLDRLADEPLLLGVRPMLQSIDDPAWILHPSRSDVFDAMSMRGLAFDALVRPVHLAAITELAQRRPDLRVVLDHAAKPDIAGGDLAGWARDMRRLATAANVTCKLSGLLTEAAPGADGEALRPVVRTLLELFGPERLIWGSDWPVVNLAGGYRRWRRIADALLAELPADGRAAIFGGNATRVYRVPMREGGEDDMSGRLAGKRTIITAAANGIGRATALAYVREGADVLATDIDEGALVALAAEGPGIRTARLDVTDADAIAALARDERADCLVQCAGLVAGGTILDCDEDAWALSWRINVTSAYRMVRAVVPGMVERGGGSVVVIGSIASSIVGVPNRFVYGVTKAALVGLTKSVAVDFVKQGVRCNIICPGTVQTPSLDARIAASPDPVQARADFVARQPMGRLGTAEEIAAMAVHLGGDESAYTTGQTFVLDGGWTAA